MGELLSECFVVFAAFQDSRQSACRHGLVDRRPVRLGGHEPRVVHSTVQGLAMPGDHAHTHTHILPRLQRLPSGIPKTMHVKALDFRKEFES